MPRTPRIEESESGTGMKSLRSSLRLLMAFASEQRDFGVGELAERCGMSKSHVSKVLAAFAETGLLVQSPESQRYSVGARMFALGSRFVTYDALCREAMPVMRDLVSRTGHSVRLSVLDDDHALYLLGIEGPLFVDTGWRAGTWLPVHSTSAGRVLLAFLEPGRADRLLGRGALRAVTPHTVTDRAQIRRLIDLARSRGYMSQRGETTPGLGTIAVPVFGGGQKVVAALGLAFPAHMVTIGEEPALADALHSSARQLSQRVGGTVYPFGQRASEMPTLNGRGAAKPRGRATTTING